MGVIRLTSFIDQLVGDRPASQLADLVRGALADAGADGVTPWLLIDGPSFAYWLAGQIGCTAEVPLPALLGADGALLHVLASFVSRALAAQGVQPLVVWDGPDVGPDFKEATHMERTLQRMRCLDEVERYLLTGQLPPVPEHVQRARDAAAAAALAPPPPPPPPPMADGDGESECGDDIPPPPPPPTPPLAPLQPQAPTSDLRDVLPLTPLALLEEVKAALAAAGVPSLVALGEADATIAYLMSTASATRPIVGALSHDSDFAIPAGWWAVWRDARNEMGREGGVWGSPVTVCVGVCLLSPRAHAVTHSHTCHPLLRAAIMPQVHGGCGWHRWTSLVCRWTLPARRRRRCLSACKWLS